MFTQETAALTPKANLFPTEVYNQLSGKINLHLFPVERAVGERESTKERLEIDVDKWTH